MTGHMALAYAAEVHQTSVRIGTSVQGRAIVAVHRWTDGATRTALIIGSMHGDERAGMRVVRRLRTASLPAGLDLWLVRTMNPDGTFYVCCRHSCALVVLNRVPDTGKVDVRQIVRDEENGVHGLAGVIGGNAARDR